MLVTVVVEAEAVEKFEKAAVLAVIITYATRLKQMQQKLCIHYIQRIW